MTYNPAIPRSTDRPSASQSQILTNFGQLNTIFGSDAGAGQVGDHIAFDSGDVADRGKHAKVRLVEQTGDPVTATDEMALYTKAVSAVSELFLRNENSGTVNQMSNLVVNSVANPGSAGGTIRYFDTVWNLRFLMGFTGAFSGTATVTYPTVFSGGSPFFLSATANDGTPQAVSAQSNTSTLTLHTSNNIVVSYFVIGRL